IVGPGDGFGQWGQGLVKFRLTGTAVEQILNGPVWPELQRFFDFCRGGAEGCTPIEMAHALPIPGRLRRGAIGLTGPLGIDRGRRFLRQVATRGEWRKNAALSVP